MANERDMSQETRGPLTIEQSKVLDTQQRLELALKLAEALTAIAKSVEPMPVNITNCLFHGDMQPAVEEVVTKPKKRSPSR